MKTNFSEAQLSDSAIAQADAILGTCQHFGFCTSGCPTYVLLHDENDGTRGRIDLIKEMLESDAPPTPKTVGHIDRCLSCMSCMTTCAVKVDYLHLVDIARAHIEENYKRPLPERFIRNALAYILPRPALFRAALGVGRIGVKARRLVPASMRHYLDIIPARPAPQQRLATPANLTCYPAQGERKWRVALLAGCVQPMLSPNINAATIRVLNQAGCEVIIPASAGCCGSLTLHMGKQGAAKASAIKNVQAWVREMDGEGLDAILVNASGCGSTVKDYAHLLAQESDHIEPARRVAQIAMDISEWLGKIDLPAPSTPKRFRVAYHDACSLRNVQKVTQPPRRLLSKAGFQVADIPEAHFCCGSAGTYNLLQPELARQLGQRKAENIQRVAPQIIAAGNIGCITQIHLYEKTPIVHTIELLDWAYGGPCPPALEGVELTELAEPSGQSASTSIQEQPIFISKPDTGSQGNDDVGVW